MMTPERTRRVRRSLLDKWQSARDRYADELRDEREKTRLREADPDQLAADPSAVAPPAPSLADARELESIVHALRRVRAGVYGRCIVCNGSIPTERLDAAPEAVTCDSCDGQDVARRATRC